MAYRKSKRARHSVYTTSVLGMVWCIQEAVFIPIAKLHIAICHDPPIITLALAIALGDSFPWSACVRLPVWFRALVWNCLLPHRFLIDLDAHAAYRH
jgi:hypothetical protein